MEQEGEKDHAKLFFEYKSFEGESAFKERTVRGRQPVLDICGYPYFVNLHAGSLEPVDFPSIKAIALKHLEHVSVHSSSRYLYYSQGLKEQLPYRKNARYPDDAVKVIIPADYVLDPVGYAREHQKDLSYCIADAMQETGGRLKLYHKAQSIPVQKKNQKLKRKAGKKL